MNSAIENKIKVVITNNKFDDSLKLLLKASSDYEKLILKGLTKRRGNNLLPKGKIPYQSSSFRTNYI